MFGSTSGARLLFVIRRTAIEDAVPVPFGGVVSAAHRDLFDRACLRAAREAMREWRFQESVNGILYQKDPIGAIQLRHRLLTEAIESRNMYCRANLGDADHAQAL